MIWEGCLVFVDVGLKFAYLNDEAHSYPVPCRNHSLFYGLLPFDPVGSKAVLGFFKYLNAVCHFNHLL